MGSQSGLDLLPEELWGEVGKRVESRLDVLRFRSVCKSWRSILPLPTLFPLNIPPPFGYEDYKYPRFITENLVYTVPGAHPYLEVGVLQHLGIGGMFHQLKLRFPGTGDCHRKLINILDNGVPVTPLAKYYHIVTAHPKFDRVDGNRAYGKSCLKTDGCTSKIVLVSNCDETYNPSYVTDRSNLAFVALSARGNLTVLRNHGHEWEWETFPRPPGAAHNFHDIVGHKGRLYVVDSQGMTFVTKDFKSMKMTQIGSYGEGFFTDSFRFDKNYRRRFVVEGTGRNGDLYMVVVGQVKIKTPTLKLFKLVQTHGWLEVQSLENQALFVGCHFSFSVPNAATTISSNVINTIFIDGHSFFDSQSRSFLPCEAFRLVCKYKDVDDKDDDDDNGNDLYCTGYSIRGLRLGSKYPIINVAAAAATTSSLISATASSIISQYESSCWKNWDNYKVLIKESYERMKNL